MSDVSVSGDNGITQRVGEIQAHAFALKGGAALNALLSGIADRKAAERMGAIEAMCFLVSNFSDEEQHAIPVVGSEQGKTGNLPFDRYSKKIKTSEGDRVVPGSWYTDVVHTTEEYTRIVKTKRWLDGVYEEGETVPPEIAALSKTGEAAAMKQTLNDRVSDMRTGLTKGSMLFHHAETISAINPARIKVRMPWRSERVTVDGQPVKIEGTNEYQTTLKVYGSKIRLTDPAGEMEDKVYSVSSFLQIKPDDAKFKALPAEGQTIAALDLTTARPSKKATTPGTATDVKVPVTVEQVLVQFNVLASGIDQEQDQGERLYAAVLAKASGKDDEARETRISIAKVCMACDSLWTIIRPMYLRDIEAQAAKSIAEQTAQSKAV